MPPTILGKLVSEKGSLVAGLAGLKLQGIGSFPSNVLASAVSAAAQDRGQKRVLSREGIVYILTYTSDGVKITVENSDDARCFIELDLLTSDFEARIKAFNHLSSLCLPLIAQGEQWKGVIAERPLAEAELVSLLSSIREAPNQFEDALRQKFTEGAGVQLADIVPDSRGYYEVLLGPVPSEQSAEAWLEDTLLPHIRLLLARDLSIGLRYALALSIDATISVAEIASSIPSHKLLPAMQRLAGLRSPYAILGMIEIAITRIYEDGFASILESLLTSYIERETSGVNEKVWHVMASLVMPSLGCISISKDMFDAPLYWRRFAAIAHTSIICEAFSEDFTGIDNFIEWITNAGSPLQLYAEIHDMRKGPLWRARDITPRGLKAILVQRLMMNLSNLKHDEEIFTNHKLIEHIEQEFVMDWGMPAALLPNFLLDEKKGVNLEVSTMSNSINFVKDFSDALLQLKTEPTGDRWGLFRGFCKIVRFDDNLLADLEKIIVDLKFDSDFQHMEKTFSALVAAAEISVAQRCQSLSHAVASTVLKEARHIRTEQAARAGFIVITMASGSISGDEAWRKWLDEKLAAYATTLPKGNACKQLLDDIYGFESLIGVNDRFLGSARMMASSAIR